MNYTKEQILSEKIAIEFQNEKDYHDFCYSINWRSIGRGKYTYPIKVRFNTNGIYCMTTSDNSYNTYYEDMGYIIEQYSSIKQDYEIY